MDALCYTLELPDGQIVGFRDNTGLLVTPSQVCAHPEGLNKEEYEVLLRPLSQRVSTNHITENELQQESNTADLQTRNTAQQAYHPKTPTSV